MMTPSHIHTFTDLDEIFARYCAGRSVIDIGGMSNNVHGTPPTEQLKRHAAKLTCVDANTSEHIDLTGIDFVQSRIQDFETDQRFDVAFCGEIIEHIADQDGFVGKVKSFLKPGGKLIVTTPNSSALSDFFRIMMSGRDPRQDQVYDPIGGVYVSGHVVIHNISTLQQLFYGSGLRVSHAYYRVPIGGSYFKQALRTALIQWRPQLSSQIVTVAESI